MNDELLLRVENLGKSFCLQLQGGLTIPVLDNASFDLFKGECLMIKGDSGRGKSTLLRMIYGNYRTEFGSIKVKHRCEMIDIATAAPRTVTAIRRHTMSYVSQFLRCLPRISALDIVAGPLRQMGIEEQTARKSAAQLMTRLGLSKRLQQLPPATFSGGEQQRVNIARGLIADHPLLLLDEPTASLDEHNRELVLELLKERHAHGTSILAVFHDARLRQRLGDREFDIADFGAVAR